MGKTLARACAVALTLAVAGGTGVLRAQDTAALPSASPILTLDQDAIYARSMFGQALRARVADEVAKLEAQSRIIDAELEAEERALTKKRSEMPAEEFAPLAIAFDEKAQRLRVQNADAIEVVRRKEQEGRQKFIAAALQVVGDYMVERGAVAIIDKGAVIVSLLGLDVTDEVVARIDAVLGNGEAPIP